MPPHGIVCYILRASPDPSLPPEQWSILVFLIHLLHEFDRSGYDPFMQALAGRLSHKTWWCPSWWEPLASSQIRRTYCIIHTSLSSSVGSALARWARLHVRSPAEDVGNVGDVNIAYMHCLPWGTSSRGRRVPRFRRMLNYPQSYLAVSLMVVVAL